MIEKISMRMKKIACMIPILILACGGCMAETDKARIPVPAATDAAAGHIATQSVHPSVFETSDAQMLSGDAHTNPTATMPPEQPTRPSSPTHMATPVPIPDQLHLPYQTVGAWWPGTTLDEIRNGELYRDITSPVAGTVFWGYTGLSGRMAYGRMFLTESGESDLWVYDYNTGKSQQWLQENVVFALWAPVLNTKLGLQPIAILTAEQALALVTGPNQMRILTENACCISWSQAADAIAFIRNGALFVYSLDGNREQKIADGLTIDPQNHLDWPIWAQEHGAIIYQGDPIRMAPLNGSASFEPEFPSGGRIKAKNAHTLLWSSEKSLLVFEEHGMQVSSGHPCDIPDNIFGRIWVVGLSQDLRTITDTFYIPDMGLHLNNWVETGETIRMTWSLMDIMVYSDAVATDEIEAIVRRYGPGTYSEDEFLLPTFPHLGYTFLWFENKPKGFERAVITDRTSISDSQGNRIHFRDLSPGMMVAITYREILEDALADEIRVIAE